VDTIADFEVVFVHMQHNPAKEQPGCRLVESVAQPAQMVCCAGRRFCTSTNCDFARLAAGGEQLGDGFAG